MDYRDKIRKLLALGRNADDFEARAAMLKARELMAKHKITEEECGVPDRKVVYERTKISCTKRTHPWITNMANVVAGAYRCVALVERAPRSKTYRLMFVGFAEDTALCNEVFSYAVDIVRKKSEKIRRGYAQRLTPDESRSRANSYGYGFVTGLKNAFRMQDESKKEEWGLVLQTPVEVAEKLQGIGKSVFRDNAGKPLTPYEYYEGKVDGERFTTKSVLKAAT